MNPIAAISGALGGLTGGGLVGGGLVGGGLPGGGLAGGGLVGGGLSGGLVKAFAGAGLDAINSWVLDGARSALQTVAHVIGASTAPNLQSAWFSATYWRVAALASLLTVPFLFAAAVHAVLRSDLGLLARAALIQLPVAVIGVTLAAPMVMLLLAATDEMCAVVAGPGSQGGARFLTTAAIAAGGASALAGSPFFAIVVGLLTVAAALGLMLELLVREAAVYVVVLMLPLAFAALVWPARRVWASRLLELLLALIIAKFAIVAVLSLAGSALGRASGVPQLLIAMALVMLSCAAPWALLRIIPFTELAANASESLRHHGHHASAQAIKATGTGLAAIDGALQLPATLRHQAEFDGQGAEYDTGQFPPESEMRSATTGSGGAGSGGAAAGEEPAPTEGAGGDDPLPLPGALASGAPVSQDGGPSPDGTLTADHGPVGSGLGPVGSGLGPPGSSPGPVGDPPLHGVPDGAHPGLYLGPGGWGNSDIYAPYATDPAKPTDPAEPPAPPADVRLDAGERSGADEPEESR